MVSQHSYFFNTSIEENLRITAPNAKKEQIIQGAKKAQIHNFIQGLPKGYNTSLGEQGLRVSGGKRQRLVIGHCPRLASKRTYFVIQ